MLTQLARSGKVLSTGLSKVAPHALGVHNVALYQLNPSNPKPPHNTPDDLLIRCCGGAATAFYSICCYTSRYLVSFAIVWAVDCLVAHETNTDGNNIDLLSRVVLMVIG